MEENVKFSPKPKIVHEIKRFLASNHLDFSYNENGYFNLVLYDSGRETNCSITMHEDSFDVIAYKSISMNDEADKVKIDEFISLYKDELPVGFVGEFINNFIQVKINIPYEDESIEELLLYSFYRTLQLVITYEECVTSIMHHSVTFEEAMTQIDCYEKRLVRKAIQQLGDRNKSIDIVPNTMSIKSINTSNKKND